MKHDRDPVRGDELAQRQLILCGREHDRGIVDVWHQAIELVWGAGREVSAAAVRVHNASGQDAAQPSAGRLWVAELPTCPPGTLRSQPESR